MDLKRCDTILQKTPIRLMGNVNYYYIYYNFQNKIIIFSNLIFERK